MHRDSFAVFAYTRADKSQYAPATVASDISRLLDPTYAYGAPPQSPQSPLSSPSSPSSPSIGYTQAKAYVDHAGDMHDPDFRDFPALPLNARRSGTRARRASSPIRGYPSYRPVWEDDEGGDAHEQDGRWPRGTASMMTFVSRPRSGSTSTMGTLAPPEPINFHHRPSFEEEVVFEEEVREPDAPATKETYHDDDDKPTPSCVDALRYQIQAIRLSLRLKIVRTQRRWRQRRQSNADG